LASDEAASNRRGEGASGKSVSQNADAVNCKNLAGPYQKGISHHLSHLRVSPVPSSSESVAAL